MRGLTVIKSAMEENNLCLAQIAAVQLRIPDLSDVAARAELEAEDRLIKAERGGDVLARAGWGPGQAPARRRAAQSGLVHPDRGIGKITA